MYSNFTGLAPPPFVVTSTDHRAFIIITASMSMVFVIVTYLLRIYTRYSITGVWDWSDHVVTAATVLPLSSIHVFSVALFLENIY